MNINSSLFHENFQIVRADTPELVDAAHQLRYQVYCEEKGYEDPSRFPDRREFDDYDSRAIHSLIRHRSSDMYIGVVRLVLPKDKGAADQPLPIEEHCGLQLDQSHPHLAELPRHSIGEISRFSVSKVFRRRVAEEGLIWGVCREGESYNADFHPQFNRRHLPMISLALIAACFRMCEEYRVDHLYAAMESTLLRLLRGVGVDFQPLGMPVEYHGMRVPAYYPIAEMRAKVLRTQAALREIYEGPEMPVYGYQPRRLVAS